MFLCIAILRYITAYMLERRDKFQILRIAVANDQVRYDSVKEQRVLFPRSSRTLRLRKQLL